MTNHECPSADAEARDDARCKSFSWGNRGPLLRCKLELGHAGEHEHGGQYGRHWTDADAEKE